MSKIVCEFCNSEVIKSQVKRHRQTNKCLLAQENKGNLILKCQCGKVFNDNSLFTNHKDICHVLLKAIIAEKDKRIAVLEVQLKVSNLEGKLEGKDEFLDYTKKNVKTINNNNNTTNNIGVMNWNQDYIKEQTQFYTLDHYFQGAKGMADFIVNHIITDKDGNRLYGCTDKNRKHFFYINERGEKVEDIKGDRLLTLVNQEVKPIATEYRKEQYTKIVNENIGEDQASDDKIARLTKENKKKYDESFSNKVLDNIVVAIY